MRPPVIDATLASPLAAPAVPKYLEQVYWWAYVHPKAVQLFERDWLVNAILFGHYATLRDGALAELGETVEGSTLQVGCAYGNLTPRLVGRLASDARLDVVDALPVQLKNLAKKLAPDDRVRLLCGDSSSLAAPDAGYDQVLLFFLLHEQPEAVRRATLSEALRVARPGGKVIIVDYHRPVRWHPLRPLMREVFRHLEPYAIDLWRQPVESYLPDSVGLASSQSRTWFGGLYEILVLLRADEPGCECVPEPVNGP